MLLIAPLIIELNPQSIEAKLNPLYVQRNAYTKQNAPVPEVITTAIKNLETQLREKGGRPTPDVKVPVDSTTAAESVSGGTPPPAPAESALTEDRAAFAQKYIGNVEKIKELQQALKDAVFYKGKVD